MGGAGKVVELSLAGDRTPSKVTANPMRRLSPPLCRASLVAGCFVWSLLAGGCGQRETPVDVGDRTKTLQLGNSSEPRDLDPHTAVSVTESNILSSLFEGLVNYAPDGKSVVPGQAERWDISPDGKTYTFHLRAGLKWSNGDPLTSADFLYSFRRLLEPDLGSELAIYGDWVMGGKVYREGKTHDPESIGFRAPDPLTFVVELKNRSPFMLPLLAQNPFYPVHRPTIEKFNAYTRREANWTRPGSLVSNGPFQLMDWRVNDAVTVKKNPGYWDAAHVGLNGAQFHPIDNVDTEERAFRSGLLHVTRGVPAVKLDAYRQSHSPLLRADPLVATKYIDFSVTKAPFNDARVREAFAMAVNRQAIVQDVMRDGSRAADTLSTPGSGVGATYSSKSLLPYDPEKARTLLAAAGFPKGAGFPVEHIIFTAAHPGEQALVEALQAMWQKELGARVELVNVEEKVWLNTMRTKQYDLLMDGWNGINDPVDLLQLFLSTSPNNSSGWVSADYDREFEAAGAAANDAERDVHLQALDRILVDELPMIPLYHQNQNYLVQPSVQGWTENMLGWHLLNPIVLRGK